MIGEAGRETRLKERRMRSQEKPMKARWLAATLLVGTVVWAGSGLAVAQKVYVANEDGNTVSVLDAASFKNIGTIPAGQAPHNVQVSPDGKLAWVTNDGEAGKESDDQASMKGMLPMPEQEAMNGRGEVWAIDTRTDTVVARIAVGKHPAHVVFTPDGRFAYVTNGGDSTLSVIDTANRQTVAVIPVGAFPHGIRVSPDGKQAYVANLKGGTVSVIDTETRKELTRIPVGKGPAQVGFTPDGKLAFVSLSGEDKVAVIDPATRRVIRKVSVGTVPIQVYATPDSRELLVANQGARNKPGKTVSVIDLETFKTAKPIETAPGTHGVTVDREGRYAYVTNTYANSVSVLDVKERKVVAVVPVGKGPNGISVTP
jgi:YVTN family beta-propeller protein